MDRAKVCAYCRVSTKDKEQLTSFENQMSYFQREFGENERYELVKLYARLRAEWHKPEASRF